jgi:hypothetical protein
MYNMTWQFPLVILFLVRSMAQNINFSHCSASFQVLRERESFRNRCLAITEAAGVSEASNISNRKAKWTNTLAMDLLKILNMYNYRLISFTNFNALFLYLLAICMLHYNPRHVSSINMPIFRTTNCIIIESSSAVCSHPAYCTAIYREWRYQMLW